MLLKLALRNVWRQIGGYLIYFVTVSLVVSLLFSFNTVIFGDVMEKIAAAVYGDILQPVLIFADCIMAAAAAVALGYATSFLLRRRKKEFGVYLTLGMTRKDVLKIFAGETGVAFLFSLGTGTVLGLGVYQAVSAMFYRFLEMEFVFAAYNAEGFLWTVAQVAGMFLLSLAASVLYLRRKKIAALLQAENGAQKKDPSSRAVGGCFRPRARRMGRVLPLAAGLHAGRRQ